ncbi:MAG: hypothetical protein ACTSP3_12745 [Candidatus Heimdallarchaeaceae archaeon]
MVKRIVFLIVLLWSSISYAQYEHVFFTGQQFVCKWDKSTLALGYETYIQRVSDLVIIYEEDTLALEISVNIQSAGTYVFYVRAWNFAEDGETIQYSELATSLTHGKVDGVDQPWQIKINLKPVGPLIIDDCSIEQKEVN